MCVLLSGKLSGLIRCRCVLVFVYRWIMLLVFGGILGVMRMMLNMFWFGWVGWSCVMCVGFLVDWFVMAVFVVVGFFF